MTDPLPLPPPDSLPQALPQDLERTASPAAGSMVRLRDVQALNRSFRRLAEVQEALLRQMQELEQERRRQRAWLAPALVAGGLAAGLGLAAVALVWWQSSRPPERIEAQAPQPPPVINLEPTPVTVQVPEDPALRAMAGVMQEHMESLRGDQLAYREQLAELTGRLLDSEQEKIDILKQIAAQPAPAAAAAEPAAPPPQLQLPGADGATADPWVGVVNGLLAVDGHSNLRFQEATRVPGAARLEDVVLLEWGADGLLAGAIRAGRAEFELHRMTGNLVLRFFDGSRAAGGARVALPSEGLRIDLEQVAVDAWLEHFPELSDVKADPESAAAAGPTDLRQPAVPGSSVRAVRDALDALISRRGSFHYYKLGALGGVDGTVLKLVQINWHDNAGRLVKTIEADTLTVRLHPKGNSVELELRNGAFLSAEGRSPFSSDLFRLYLPKQDLDAWRASGVPYVEAAG